MLMAVQSTKPVSLQSTFGKVQDAIYHAIFYSIHFLSLSPSLASCASRPVVPMVEAS